MKTKYFCPVDNDVVLFEESLTDAKMFAFDRAATCPQCGKSYFKTECVMELPFDLDDDE